MNPIFETRQCGLVAVIWQDNSIDVLTVQEAEDLKARLWLCLMAVGLREVA